MEFLDLNSVASASGDVKLPGSKSISNRVLLLASLAKGKTVIKGLLKSEDTHVMLEGLKTLGLAVNMLSADSVEIEGLGYFPQKNADLFLANAGTAFRPLTAALALSNGHYQLSGVPRMHERPIGDLVEALKAIGANIDYLQNDGFPPLSIKPGHFAAGQTIKVDGSVSSQFLTALLLSSPLLAQQTQQNVKIEVVGELISKPYIGITLNLMQRFGVTVKQQGWESFEIEASASYQSPGEIWVEGDASSASYFLGLGAIAGGPITIHGVGANSIQGDTDFARFVESIGAKVEFFDNAIKVQGVSVAKGERLQAFDCDFNLIPDAAMTAAILAVYADGPCYLRNIASWRVKETDRIHAMHTELAKLGAQVESGPDWLKVTPVSNWQDAEIFTYDDHRMAMCFSLASLSPAKIRILDPNCVRKTFPDYFSVFQTLVR